MGFSSLPYPPLAAGVPKVPWNRASEGPGRASVDLCKFEHIPDSARVPLLSYGGFLQSTVLMI